MSTSRFLHNGKTSFWELENKKVKRLRKIKFIQKTKRNLFRYTIIIYISFVDTQVYYLQKLCFFQIFVNIKAKHFKFYILKVHICKFSRYSFFIFRNNLIELKVMFVDGRQSIKFQILNANEFLMKGDKCFRFSVSFFN